MPYQRQQLLLVGLFAGLVALKLPGVFNGRLWAEDGLFLLDALRLPWWQALITPHTGYIDVTASTAFVIATRLVDLEYVGIISVIFALFIQACPAILIVTSPCEWLRRRWIMMIALLLILAPPVAEEVWLSPVTSQYHMIICTGLILAFDIGRRAVFSNILLAFAGLTGPGPALLAPLFVLRAYLDRSKRRALQAAILCTGALIEFIVFCTHPEPNRWLVIDLTLLAHVIAVKHLVLPLVGRDITMMINQSMIWIAILLPVGIGIVWAVLISHRREVVWLFAATVTVMVLSYLGSLGHKADLLNVGYGQRYYYAPQVLLSLTLLGLTRNRQPVPRYLAWTLVTWLLVVGAWQYFQVIPAMAAGPSWYDQIVLWRDRPDRAIYLWPPSIIIPLPRA